MNFKKTIIVVITLLIIIMVAAVRSASIDISSALDQDLEEDTRGGKTIRFGRTPPRRPIFLGDWSRYDKHPDYEQFLA